MALNAFRRRRFHASQVAYVWLHNESTVNWSTLNASERARVEAALSCDARLYAEAERRADQTGAGCRGESSAPLVYGRRPDAEGTRGGPEPTGGDQKQ